MRKFIAAATLALAALPASAVTFGQPDGNAGRPACAYAAGTGSNGSMPSNGMSAAISSISASAALRRRRYIEASRAALRGRAHLKNGHSMMRVTKRSG